MKSGSVNPQDRIFEIGIPICLTIVWFIGLAAIAFDWIKKPSLLYSPPLTTHQIIIDIRIVICLFFLELCLYCIDFAYQSRNKSLDSGKVVYCVGGVIFALACYIFIESFILWNGSKWWLLLLAIIFVAVPKLFSCELSRNPHHFTKKRKRRTLQESKLKSSELTSAYIDYTNSTSPLNIDK